jgi:hypothetical protein
MHIPERRLVKRDRDEHNSDHGRDGQIIPIFQYVENEL